MGPTVNCVVGMYWASRTYRVVQTGSSEKVTRLPLAAGRVAIIGHAEFFKEFVTIKMTACQMIWQEIPSAEELLQRAVRDALGPYRPGCVAVCRSPPSSRGA